MKKDLVVVVRGAGEMASGVAWRLHKAHFRVLLTEVATPLAVRRAVSFCEALYEGVKTVEDVRARLVEQEGGWLAIWEQGDIPLVVDSELASLSRVGADALVDATLAKRDNGLRLDLAPLVIALGPFFEAGKHAHYVLETNRGHHLGRIYEQGRAQENTGVPGDIAGKTWQRVMRSMADGEFCTDKMLGDVVEAGECVATVAGQPVVAGVAGILRGLIRPGTMVTRGLKVGDVDPRGDRGNVNTISEKARALGGSVLETILRKYNA